MTFAWNLLDADLADTREAERTKNQRKWARRKARLLEQERERVGMLDWHHGPDAYATPTEDYDVLVWCPRHKGACFPEGSRCPSCP